MGSSLQDLEERIGALEATVGALRDRAAIQDLRFRYHIAVNDRELDSIGSLFTEDATVDFGGIGSARGRKQIEALYEQVVGGAPFVKQFIHNHTITLNGDRASGLSYLEAKTVTHGESYMVAARFDDEYLRDRGEWRFVRLALVPYFVVPLREGWAGEEKIRLSP